MFFRQKRSGQYVYLQIVENRWEKGRSGQRVVATVGRLDQLKQSGRLEGLLQSGAKFAEGVMVLSAHRRGEVPAMRHCRIGPARIFGRLWEELKIPQVIQRLLAGRRCELPLEQILFLTVLHRLFVSGSDRSCVLNWKERYAIPGVEAVGLHQVYRAMAWLGERLPEDEQAHATPFAPRCTKDAFEETLFARRRDRFTHLELVFFATTSISFEGAGGEELGQYGKSKDHRPDCRQMVVAVVLDGRGRPICCELWPGNVTDVKTLIPVVDRLRQRLQHGDTSLVGNKGYRRYLSSEGPHFTINEAKVKWEERLDGKWVLQTDLEDLTAEETALQYKQLWMGGRDVSRRQDALGNAAHLPQVRGDDPRPRVLRLPGVDPAQRTAGPPGGAGREVGMGGSASRLGGPGVHGG